MPLTRLALGMPRTLMAAADDGGGGGGGGGGKDKDDKKDDTGGLSEEQRKEIAKHVGGAVANHSKKLREEIMAAVTSTLEEKLKSFSPVPEKKDDANKDKKDEDPEKLRLRSELDQLTRKFTEQETARQAERERGLRSEEKQQLTEELRKAGIHDARLKGAVAYLLHEARVVRRDKEGAIVWPTKRDWGEEEISLDKGVAEWLATDEGKSYLPPKDAKGSGNTGGKAPKPGEKLTQDQANQVLSSFLFGGGGQ